MPTNRQKMRELAQQLDGLADKVQHLAAALRDDGSLAPKFRTGVHESAAALCEIIDIAQGHVRRRHDGPPLEDAEQPFPEI